MGLVLSLLYAPFVFFAIRLYDLQTVALSIAVMSVLWLFTVLVQKGGFKAMVYPLLYLSFGVSALVFEKLLILKALPVLISVGIAGVFIVSYLRKRSIILYFARYLKGRELSKEQELYIHNSTRFWIAVTLLNVAIHCYALFGNNLAFWAFYGSVGGYGLLALAGVAQFVHKKLVFDRQVKAGGQR